MRVGRKVVAQLGRIKGADEGFGGGRSGGEEDTVADLAEGGEGEMRCERSEEAAGGAGSGRRGEEGVGVELWEGLAWMNGKKKEDARRVG